MKIIVIGATGTIGKAVTEELSARHEVIKVGYTSGDIQVDITNNESIKSLFETTGMFDAVILTSGKVHFGDFLQMTEDEFMLGLHNKLMGQINTVLIGKNYINEGGSFTLTSGILSDDPIRFSCSASTVNGALNSFVKSAAIEMPKGIRINCVSPTVVTEALEGYGPYFRGFESVSSAWPIVKVLKGYKQVKYMKFLGNS